MKFYGKLSVVHNCSVVLVSTNCSVETIGELTLNDLMGIVLIEGLLDARKAAGYSAPWQLKHGGISSSIMASCGSRKQNADIINPLSDGGGSQTLSDIYHSKDMTGIKGAFQGMWTDITGGWNTCVTR